MKEISLWQLAKEELIAENDGVHPSVPEVLARIKIIRKRKSDLKKFNV